MKRAISLLLLSLLLTSCAPHPVKPDEHSLSVVATAYPVYALTAALTAGVEGIDLHRLNTGEASCLHDYTLSVSDMKLIEQANILAMNGAGLEDFMDTALAASSAAVIDCSQGVDLLENEAHDHQEEEHDHGHYDPHYWMDPKRAQIMVENLANGLSLADPTHAQHYADAAILVQSRLNHLMSDYQAGLWGTLSGAGLITFHDGFRYFSEAFGLDLLAAIEEEAGSEASAREIVSITALVQQEQLPAIFIEVNGSSATADAIARETGCAVYPLSMLMSGPDAHPGWGLDACLDNMYLSPLFANLDTLQEAFQ